RPSQDPFPGLPTAATIALPIVGMAALAASLWLGWNQSGGAKAFLASYLVNYCFFLSITLGALFFVALQHVVRAGWSIAIRRVAEILAANTSLMAILFVPILLSLFFDSARIYIWSDPAIVADNRLLEYKTPYLNVPFFIVRTVIYFAIWIGTSRFFLSESTCQDETGDPDATHRMEKFAPLVLVLFGITVTFVSFDWLMSLEPYWFSTIYGLYFFAGAVVGFFSTLLLITMALQATGWASSSITTEHYHELGKLLFGFIIFWGYMAFSQYMLIWYANIPESVWYLVRQRGSWAWIGIALLFGHLLIPMVGLMSREVKRRKFLLGAWAVWIFVFHWLDLYWLVMPVFSPDRLSFGMMDLCCFAGMGCLFLAGLNQLARQRALVPAQDPRLDESLAFENL
ncbi:MAG: quinol:cytochrome C oxidoreductase, partial [Pirellulales bacterium]|nr:quinol:cytochrome C oxidoreductase [Pirellulales bacterium]